MPLHLHKCIAWFVREPSFLFTDWMLCLSPNKQYQSTLID